MQRNHLAGAGHFAALCQEMEANHAGVVFDKLPPGEPARHRYYCIAAVMLAVSALDAYAKEAFYDGKKGLRGVTGAQRKEAREKAKKRIEDVMNAAKKPDEQKERVPSILADYESILMLSGLPEVLDVDSSDFEDVRLLIFTRNALVHVEPEWRDEKKMYAEIGEALKAVGFSPNPFLPPETVYFPVHGLRTSCVGDANGYRLRE